MEIASFFSPEHIIQSGGLIAIGLIIFSECGLLVGLLFPGDSLLLVAGLFAAQGKLPLGWLLATVILASIIGYQVGYRIGERLGPKMFKRQEGILFRREYIKKTRDFFERYGKITIVLIRFVAHARTFASLVAGAGQMDKRSYFIYNVIGGFLWGAGLTLVGYVLGTSVPNIDKYFIPAILGFLVLFYSVVLWELLKSPTRRQNLWSGLKSDLRYIFSRNK